MKSNTSLSRRNFMGQAACAGIGMTPLLSTLFNLKMTANAASVQSNSEDYKALVCLFLAGGNDSFNMLIPTSGADYANYASIRAELALPVNTLHALNGIHGGKTYAVHPSMPQVQGLFNNGELAFVTNVGTLVEPTTLAQYQQESVRLPDGLFSHADQIMQWQTSVPDQRTPYGWGGRVADILQANNTNQSISMSISLSGINTFQAGLDTVSYEIDSSGSGAYRLQGMEGIESSAIRSISEAAVNSLMDLQYRNVFQQHFARVHRRSIDTAQVFAGAIDTVSVNTPFSANPVSQSFRMAAKTIAARKSLGMKRQTFFIQFGGWDHHDEVLNNQLSMLGVVSNALNEFNLAMKELGLHDKVTTFTASDFARTLTSNGQGTDHGWGGNHLVMGGAVQGAQIVGAYPELAAGNSLDTGRGRLIPTLSTDEYFADLARWFGVPNGRLGEVLPNLDRFPGANDSLGVFRVP